jgi:hypothetical protein
MRPQLEIDMLATGGRSTPESAPASAISERNVPTRAWLAAIVESSSDAVVGVSASTATPLQR